MTAARWAVAGVGAAGALGIVRWLFRDGTLGRLSSGLTPWPLFVPPLMVLAAAAALLVAFPRLTPRRMAMGLALIAALLLMGVPWNILMETVTPPPLDDGSIYLSRARFMLEQRTLMAGQAVFDRQPGYPYVLLVLLWLPGFPNRLYQLALACALVIVVSACTQALRVRPAAESQGGRSLIRSLMMAFPLLAIPYFLKNLYLGLPEWLVFALVFLALVLWRRGNLVACAACLGAIAVLRQNLLIASLLLQVTAWVDASRGERRRTAHVAFVVWAVIALAPALHNFYYGGTLALLAQGTTLTLADNWIWQPVGMLQETLLKYIGYSPAVSPPALLFSLVSVPVGTALVALLTSKMAREAGGRTVLFLALVASCVIPTALFGLAYYPRFELLNLSLACAGYGFIRDARFPAGRLFGRGQPPEIA